jgi:hypothetical protein
MAEGASSWAEFARTRGSWLGWSGPAAWLDIDETLRKGVMPLRCKIRPPSVGFPTKGIYVPLFGVVDAPTGSTALPGHPVLHGIVMTAWSAFVVTQTVLVSTRNVVLHRRLGAGGIALAVIVIAMYTLVQFLARRDARGIPTGEQQDGVVLGDTLAMLFYFPVLVASGIYLRRDPAAHKRLMLLSSIVMLGPGAIWGAAQDGGAAHLFSRCRVTYTADDRAVRLRHCDPEASTLGDALRSRDGGALRSDPERLLNTAPAAAYIQWLRDLN